MDARWAAAPAVVQGPMRSAATRPRATRARREHAAAAPAASAAPAKRGAQSERSRATPRGPSGRDRRDRASRTSSRSTVRDQRPIATRQARGRQTRGARRPRGAGQAGHWEVGGHEVALTNLDKVLFPRVGHHQARPGPLLRHDRAGDPALPARAAAQRRIAGRTAWHGRPTSGRSRSPRTHLTGWRAGTTPRPGRSQSHTYVVADRVATMAWLANQAVIDLHPWTSRTARLPATRPTRSSTSTPGEKTTWEELLTLARLYRTALEHLGVRGFPKVTGKRGIQVWIPIEPRYTFDETRDWVGSCRAAVGAVVPELSPGSGARTTAAGAPARLHPERDQQDARGALRGAAGADRGGFDAHQLGRSSTTLRSARDAGTSGRSSNA